MNFLTKNQEHKIGNKFAVSKTKTIKIFVLCFITTMAFGQKRLNKTQQDIKVNKDVVVDLNTNYVEIEIDTWSKNEVSVEAFLESEKLSESELKEALKSWNLNVDASMDKVSISSEGAGSFPRIFASRNNGDYDDILQELELNLAEMPKVPEVIVIPDVPQLGALPAFPDLPKLPEFPALPELPEDINTIKFDYDRYQKEGEKYLSEWSKEYEEKGGKELQEKMEAWAKKFAESGYEEKMKKWGEKFGKKFEGKWAKDMEEWGEKFGESFGKDMEKWGEEFGEKFGKEWAEKMEAWGERFGEQMERRAEAMERREEAMERRSEAMEKRREQTEIRLAERERREKEKDRRESIFVKRYNDGVNSNVKRVIKIKMPKKAKLKLNVRHGELKVASAIHNAKGNVSHTFLVAERIDGSDTSINVSYSPMVINNWDNGSLGLNFVDNAQIKSANTLLLTSKSSNIAVDNLLNTGVINGSFGDLTISNLAETFNNLNLILENTDAVVDIPSNVNYSLFFSGNRSRYNNVPTKQKSFKKDESKPSSKNIVVNAKFSNVTIN